MDEGQKGRSLMQAFPDGELLVLKRDGEPVPNTARYRRFEGAIAWLDPDLADHGAHNWLVIVGEQEDGAYCVEEEHFGSLDQIATAAVDAKDRFLMKRIYVDDTNIGAVRALRDVRQVDGLTGYDTAGDSPLGIPLWTHENSFWPHFRDRNTNAALVALSPDIRVDLGSGYEVLRGLTRNDRLTTAQKIQYVDWIMRHKPPLDEVFRHPLTKALCWLLTMMERTRETQTTRKQAASAPWYGNPR